MRLYFICIFVVINIYSTFAISTSSHLETHSKCGKKCRGHNTNLYAEINEGSTELKKKHEGVDNPKHGFQGHLPSSSNTMGVLNKRKNIAYPHVREENNEDEDYDDDDDDGDDSDDTDSESPPGTGDIIVPLDNMNNDNNNNNNNLIENEAYRSAAQAKSDEMALMLKQHYMQTAALQSQVGAPGVQYSRITTGGGNVEPPIMKHAAVDAYTRNYAEVNNGFYMKQDPEKKHFSSIPPMAPQNTQFGTVMSNIRSPIMKPPAAKTYSDQIREIPPGGHYGVIAPDSRASITKPSIIRDISESPVPPTINANSYVSTEENSRDGTYNGIGKGNGIPQIGFEETGITNSFEPRIGHNNFGNNQVAYQGTNMENVSPSMGHMSSLMENTNPSIENMRPSTEIDENEEGDDDDDEDDDTPDTPGTNQEKLEKLDPLMAEEVNRWQASYDPIVSKIYQESTDEKNVKETLANPNKYISSDDKYLPDLNKYLPDSTQEHTNKRKGNSMSLDYTDTRSKFIKNDEKSIATNSNADGKKSLLRGGFVGSLYDHLLAEDQNILNKAFHSNHKKLKKEVAVQEDGGKRHFFRKHENVEKKKERDEYKTKDGISLEKLLKVITPTEDTNNNDDTSASSRTLAEDQKSSHSDEHLVAPLSTIDKWANGIFTNANISSTLQPIDSSNTSVTAQMNGVNLKDLSNLTSNTFEANSTRINDDIKSKHNDHFNGFTIVGNKGDQSVVVAITVTKPGNITNSSEHTGLSPLDNKAIGNVITSMINAASMKEEHETLGTISRDSIYDDAHSPNVKLVNSTQNISGVIEEKWKNSISHTTPTNATKSSATSNSKASVSSILLENNANISSIVSDIDNMVHPSLQQNSTNASLGSFGYNIKEFLPSLSINTTNMSAIIDDEDTASKCLSSRSCRKKVLSKFIDSSVGENGKNDDDISITRASVDKNETKAFENKTMVEKNETMTIENKTDAHAFLKKKAVVVIEIADKEVKSNENMTKEDNEKVQTKDITPSKLWKTADQKNISTKENTEILESGSTDDHDYVKNSEESKVNDLPKVSKKSIKWKSKTNKASQNYAVSKLINKNLQRIEDILKRYHGYQKKYKQIIEESTKKRSRIILVPEVIP